VLIPAQEEEQVLLHMEVVQAMVDLEETAIQVAQVEQAMVLLPSQYILVPVEEHKVVTVEVPEVAQ
jgi:hypothetical protein